MEGAASLPSFKMGWEDGVICFIDDAHARAHSVATECEGRQLYMYASTGRATMSARQSAMARSSAQGQESDVFMIV